MQESGTLVAPTPSERSATHPDVPGSGFLKHSSSYNTSSNSDVTGSVAASVKGNSFLGTPVTSPGLVEARNWLELTRMGEELSRSGSREFTLLSNSFRPDEPNGYFYRPTGGSSNVRRFLGNKNSSFGNFPHNNNNNNNFNNGISRPSNRSVSSNDIWSIKADNMEESSDSGWVRGVAGRHRWPTNTFSGNGVVAGNSNANPNLPPRMLRRLAAEAAANLSCNGNTNCDSPGPSNIVSSDQFSSSVSRTSSSDSVEKNSTRLLRSPSSLNSAASGCEREVLLNSQSSTDLFEVSLD